MRLRANYIQANSALGQWLSRWGFYLITSLPFLLVFCGAGWELAAEDLSKPRAGTLVNLMYTSLTALLVILALGQIANSQRATRTSLDSTRASLDYGADQQRKWATLQACDRYDTDPQIASAVRFLRRYHPFGEPRLNAPHIEGHKSTIEPAAPDPSWAGLSDDHRYVMSAGLLLNYFDSIAIGINQGFYDDKICRAHIGGIVKTWIAKLGETESENFQKVMSENFEHTNRMNEEWSKGS